MSKVTIDIARVQNVALSNAKTGMAKAVAYIAAIVDNSLRQKGTGRVYKRGARTHTASAPGNAPASDTGRLRGAVDTQVTVTSREVIGTISANTEYALPLELGTSKMAARPFLRPAIEKNKAKIAGFFK